MSGNAGKLLGVAVRTDRFRYAEYTSGGAMLFDHTTDPGETKNLRRTHPNIADELQTLLHKWRTEVEAN